MKELIYLAIGVMVGTYVMKKSQTIDNLENELERERARHQPDDSAR